jgi:hypothetical protein
MENSDVNKQGKAVETTKQKEEKGKNLSPRSMKACHSISTPSLQSVAGIGAQSTMTRKAVAKRRCMNSRRASPIILL